MYLTSVNPQETVIKSTSRISLMILWWWHDTIGSGSPLDAWHHHKKVKELKKLYQRCTARDIKGFAGNDLHEERGAPRLDTDGGQNFNWIHQKFNSSSCMPQNKFLSRKAEKFYDLKSIGNYHHKRLRIGRARSR